MRDFGFRMGAGDDLKIGVEVARMFVNGTAFKAFGVKGPTMIPAIR